MEFDLEDPLAGASPEDWGVGEDGAPDISPADSAAALFSAESDHVCFPGKLDRDDLRVSVRRDAVSVLLQAQGNGYLDDSVVYLATNYIDRFLSCEAIPRDKPWIARLLAIACLSLACKMKKVEFSVSYLQAEEGMICNSQTIRRMELLVLRALQWRMRSITPFSFLRFFLSLFRPAERPLLAAIKARASEFLFRAQHEMKLLGRKPSTVAASALLAACYELFPIQFPSFRDTISSCTYLNKEAAWECFAAMEALTAVDSCNKAAAAAGGAAAASSSCCDTPVSVLRQQHRHCSSSESESTAVASGVDRDLKKRRVGGLVGEYCSVFLRSPDQK